MYHKLFSSGQLETYGVGYTLKGLESLSVQPNLLNTWGRSEWGLITCRTVFAILVYLICQKLYNYHFPAVEMIHKVILFCNCFQNSSKLKKKEEVTLLVVESSAFIQLNETLPSKYIYTTSLCILLQNENVGWGWESHFILCRTKADFTDFR